MQVNALTAAYTGSQRQSNDLLFSNPRNPQPRAFEEYLDSPSPAATGAAMAPTSEDLDAAMQRTLNRITVLLGERIAEDIVNADGTINVVRLAQVMNSIDQPYSDTLQPNTAISPRMVNVLA